MPAATLNGFEGGDNRYPLELRAAIFGSDEAIRREFGGMVARCAIMEHDDRSVEIIDDTPRHLGRFATPLAFDFPNRLR